MKQNNSEETDPRKNKGRDATYLDEVLTQAEAKLLSHAAVLSVIWTVHYCRPCLQQFLADEKAGRLKPSQYRDPEYREKDRESLRAAVDEIRPLVRKWLGQNEDWLEVLAVLIAQDAMGRLSSVGRQIGETMLARAFEKHDGHVDSACREMLQRLDELFGACADRAVKKIQNLQRNLQTKPQTKAQP